MEPLSPGTTVRYILCILIFFLILHLQSSPTFQKYDVETPSRPLERLVFVLCVHNLIILKFHTLIVFLFFSPFRNEEEPFSRHATGVHAGFPDKLEPESLSHTLRPNALHRRHAVLQQVVPSHLIDFIHWSYFIFH